MRDQAVLQPNVRLLRDVLSDGAWAGDPAICVGGGPSLIGFDWERLRGWRVIGVNRVFEQFDPAVIFTMDVNFINWVLEGRYGRAAIDAWRSSKATKVILRTANKPVPDGMCLLPIYKSHSHGHRAFPLTMAEGIGHGNNSGYGALNLAVCLGANPIYLLGYDMKFGQAQAIRPDVRAALQRSGLSGQREGVRTHWHDGHPNKLSEGMLAQFAVNFNYASLECRRHSIDVVNLNPGSALKCFRFGDADALLGPAPAARESKQPITVPVPPAETTAAERKWAVVSFYTVGTGYEREVKKLEASLRAIGLQYRLYPCPATGSWRGNLNHKSACILRAFDEFPDKDIVFIDADAVVRKDPVLFDELSAKHEYDLSAHFYSYTPRSGDRDELLSGTLWIRNGGTGRALVNRWHEIGLRRPDVRHQKCLHLAIKELQAEGVDIRVFRHPFVYTCIFDSHAARGGQAPVIEHFQASRYLRREVGQAL